MTPIAKRAQVAARRAEAIDARIRGESWQTIADRLGYASRGAAHTDVTRALDEHRTEAAQSAGAFRELELLKLDALEREAWEIINADHPIVQGGKIIEGVNDVGPTLRATTTVLRVSERRARLLGLDEPERMEAVITAEVRAQGEAIAAVLLTAVGRLGLDPEDTDVREALASAMREMGEDTP